MREQRFGHPWWTRRGFLQGGAAVVAGIYGLPGRLGHAAEIPDEFDGSKFQLTAPEPNPKHGGVLRYGILMRPPHFDIHQAGTIAVLGRLRKTLSLARAYYCCWAIFRGLGCRGQIW